MTSKNVPGDHGDESFGDCTWLAGTAFQTKEAKDVFEIVLQMDYAVINQTISVRPVPLSVCKCSKLNNTSNCFTPNLGDRADIKS